MKITTETRETICIQCGELKQDNSNLEINEWFLCAVCEEEIGEALACFKYDQQSEYF